MPRVLVTGGCGFLGSHIIEGLLKETDMSIVVLDKLSYASNGYNRLREIGAYENPRVRVLACDLSQPIQDGLSQEIGDFDDVIHAAAETHVDNSIVDPLPFLTSNVIGTHHLLWWLRAIGWPNARSNPEWRGLFNHLFIVSTDEVYGPAKFGDDVAGFDELARFRPANPYAAAKAGQEAVAMAYRNTYGLPITIVNTMNLVGERQHHEKFVPLVIRRVLQGEKVTIHADSTKTRAGTRFYLHCRTYADALIFLLDAPRLADVRWAHDVNPDGPGFPLKLHVCGEREISNLELAQLIAGYVGKPLNYEMVDWHASRPGHDLRYAMCDNRIQSMGWRRPMNIEESLRKTVAWYMANTKWLGL